jgi:hypothetical protein
MDSPKTWLSLENYRIQPHECADRHWSRADDCRPTIGSAQRIEIEVVGQLTSVNCTDRWASEIATRTAGRRFLAQPDRLRLLWEPQVKTNGLQRSLVTRLLWEREI